MDDQLTNHPGETDPYRSCGTGKEIHGGLLSEDWTVFSMLGPASVEQTVMYYKITLLLNFIIVQTELFSQISLDLWLVAFEE